MLDQRAATYDDVMDMLDLETSEYDLKVSTKALSRAVFEHGRQLVIERVISPYSGKVYIDRVKMGDFIVATRTTRTY